eukprot:jgi/Botrbrau1/3867/Bobra.0183s0091.1
MNSSTSQSNGAHARQPTVGESNSARGVGEYPGGPQGPAGRPRKPSIGTGRRGMLVVLRLREVGLVGESAKIPSLSIAQISIHLEFHCSLAFEYHRVTGWRAAGAPVLDVIHLHKEVHGASVPVPRFLLKLILTSVLPGVLQRSLQLALPAELGSYLLDSALPLHLAGDLGVAGASLAALDTPLPFHMGFVAGKSREAALAAEVPAAAAFEARSLLGLSLDQAAVLGDLFASKLGLLEFGKPLTLSSLQAYHQRHSRNPSVWSEMCAVWDAAASLVARSAGMKPPPPFATLTASARSHLLLKPVLARLEITKLEVAVDVDSVLEALRSFAARTAAELAAKGTGPAGTSLEEQLQGLEAWHTYTMQSLRSFKAAFKGAGCRAVVAADAEGLSAGCEAVRYCGPLRVTVPVRLDPASAADGCWSFSIPLPKPNPGTVRLFMDAIRSAIASPPSVPLSHASGLEGLGTQGLQRSTSSRLQGEFLAGARKEGPLRSPESPMDWFSDEAQRAAGSRPLSTLGTVLVAGLRVKVALDEERVSEMLRGLTAATLGDEFGPTAGGLLACLGELASLSFMPATSEDGDAQYVLSIKSSSVSNVTADVASLAFRSGEGVTPARLLRIGHAIARAAHLALAGTPESLATLDGVLDAFHAHVGNEKLDVAVCLEASAAVNRNALVVRLGGASEKDPEGSGLPSPLLATAEFELGRLWLAT